MKTIVITGATSGMGYETAFALAKEKHHLILVCRSLNKGQDTKNKLIHATQHKKIEVVEGDFSSLESLKKATKQILQIAPVIDVVVNNAGVLTTEKRHTQDGLEEMMGVNYIGLLYFTEQLLPAIQQAEQGRIINVSSITYKGKTLTLQDLHPSAPFKSMQTYGKSKLGTILYTKYLAQQLHNTSVTVNALHPGVVSTSIGVNRETGKEGLMYKLFGRFFKTPEQGAQTSIYLAVNPSVSQKTGKFFIDKQQKEVIGQGNDLTFAEAFVKETKHILEQKGFNL